MSHIHYEEVQRFSQLRWLWVIAIVVLLFPLVFFALSEGNFEEHSWQIVLSTLAACFPVGMLLAFGKFEVRVNESGLQYRFMPTLFKWKVIDKSKIESIEVREKKGLYEHISCGYRRHYIRKTIFMNITGTRFVITKLTNGFTLKMGSQQADTFGANLKKLINSNNAT